jgi:hypothetical protein
MKISIFIIFFILVSASIFSDDWEFIVIHDSPIYTTFGSSITVGILPIGKVIVTNNNVGYGLLRNDIGEIPYMGFNADREYPYIQRHHVTDGRNIIPANTLEFFGTDILGDGKRFLISYCCDILRSGNRETVFSHEPYYREHQSYFEDAYMRRIYWYERYNENWCSFFVFNAVLSFGYRRQLIINNIKKTEYGYKVRCKESAWNNMPTEKIPTLEWGVIQNHEEFDLLIYFNGDYIDLYADNTENKIATFVSVSDEFVIQFNSLIKTNTCDLTNVQWPRRADGSMDYPPLPGVSGNTSRQETIEEPVDTVASWVVTSGAVVIAGGAVVFAVKRKK